MTHDKAFNTAIQKSVDEETDYVVFRTNLSDYGAMIYENYDGYTSSIVAIFEKGIRIDSYR